MTHTARYLLCALVAFILAISTGHAERRPVIFIPGILGSKLEYVEPNGTKTLIWGDYFATRTHFRRLAFPLNPREDRVVATSLLDKVDILGPFGIGTYDGIDRFLRLKLANAYFPFAYDWRQSNFASADDLKKFIDKNSLLRNAALNGEGIIVVAHSMGGLVARVFIERYGAQYKVSRLVTIATPYYGSINALQSFLKGLSNYWQYISSDDKTVREVFYSLPSVYELLPRYDHCCIDGAPTDPGRHPLFVPNFQVWQTRKWIPAEYATGQRLTFVKNALQCAEKLDSIMDTPMPVSIRRFFIAGFGKDMTAQVYFPKDAAPIWKPGTDGDDTVYRVSATIPRPTAPDAIVPMLVAKSHVGLLNDPSVQSQLDAQIVSDADSLPFDATVGPKTFLVRTRAGSFRESAGVSITLTSHYLPAGSAQTVAVRVFTADLTKATTDAVIAATLVAEGQPDKVLEPEVADDEFRFGFRVPEAPGPARIHVEVGRDGAFDEWFGVIPPS